MKPAHVHPAEDPPRQLDLASFAWHSQFAARRRLHEATEEVTRAARALNMDVPADCYCSWRIRAMAWLWTASQLLATHESNR